MVRCEQNQGVRGQPRLIQTRQDSSYTVVHGLNKTIVSGQIRPHTLCVREIARHSDVCVVYGRVVLPEVVPMRLEESDVHVDRRPLRTRRQGLEVVRHLCRQLPSRRKAMRGTRDHFAVSKPGRLLGFVLKTKQDRVVACFVEERRNSFLVFPEIPPPVRQAQQPDLVWVSTCENRSPGGRTHRRGRERIVEHDSL